MRVMQCMCSRVVSRNLGLSLLLAGFVLSAADNAYAPVSMLSAGAKAPAAASKPWGGNQASAPAPDLGPAVRHYDLNVSLVRGAPDCFQKTLLLANGQWGYPIEVTTGEILEVTVTNSIPSDFPSSQPGISIHWHGLNMRGDENGAWYDGVSYVTQCPIPYGQSMTYRFLVDETPGTYFWHGHTSLDRVDGLFGPLIVRPKGKEPLQYDDEMVLLVGDWYHGQADVLSMKLNRPFDAGKQTNDSGGWQWVDLPQSVLLNGHGFYEDCELLGAGNTATPISCDATEQYIPAGRSKILPFNDPTNPGCQRYNATVEQGKTYRIRIINVGSLGYLTLVFEGHPVTIIAADGVPVHPLEVDQIDINLGQRYDVLLKADQPVGNYWITAQVQFRTGSPSGYGILRYKGANSSLPSSASPPPDTYPPWTLDELQEIRSLDTTKPSVSGSFEIVFPGNLTSLRPPDATRTLLLNNTQPLLTTGQLRWALNNVAAQLTPSCTSFLDNAYANGAVTNYIPLQQRGTTRDAAPRIDDALTNESGNDREVALYSDDSPIQTSPVPGQHVVVLNPGDVVDVILINLPANANNGDYRPGVGANRTATEQHPFHMHGHHFWVLGHGVGKYNPANASLNTEDPPFRDTYTVFKGGWTVIRFIADNPGTWLLHCHTDWHQFMGQRLVFAENLDAVSDKPQNVFPECPATCRYSFAPYTKSYVKELYGSTGY
eukprot:jgi/Botrbrau1/18246/Bobra.0844s0001.1